MQRRCRTRWAACSAAAPAIARSSRPCSMSPAPRCRRRPAQRWARASPKSTARRSSPAPSVSAPTTRRRMPCGCGGGGRPLRVLTAADTPGANRFGIYPTGKDQPVLAEDQVRFRGEAVVALVGDAATVEAIRDDELPIAWQSLPPVTGIAAALAPGAPALHREKPDNVLIAGRVVRGDVQRAIAAATATVEGAFRTAFVEHAYIEPEAGYARRIGDRIEIFACTQSPYMHRDELALVLGIPPEAVRIVPSAV